MKDTNAEFMAMYRVRIDALSDGQRLLRGLRMFDDGKTFLRAGIRHDHPELSDAEIEQRVFLRLYGDDLPADAVARALARIAERFAAEARQ